jgi:lysozyme family protein
MMEQREIDAMIGRLMAREGGWVDHAWDGGGCTNHGITLPTLEMARGFHCSCADVQVLSRFEAAEIYTRFWFDHSRLRLRHWPYRRLAEVTLDASVMFSLGRSMAVGWVQEAINRRLEAGDTPLKIDGWAGERTLDAMLRFPERELVAAVVGARCRKHARVVAARPVQAVFLAGWINRATDWVMG